MNVIIELRKSDAACFGKLRELSYELNNDFAAQTFSEIRVRCVYRLTFLCSLPPVALIFHWVHNSLHFANTPSEIRKCINTMQYLSVSLNGHWSRYQKVVFFPFLHHCSPISDVQGHLVRYSLRQSASLSTERRNEHAIETSAYNEKRKTVRGNSILRCCEQAAGTVRASDGSYSVPAVYW